MKNAINWFEIPVTNMDRAAKFYATVFEMKLKLEDFGGVPNAIFPREGEGACGSLVLNPRRKPSADGSLVYLNATGKLDDCIGRVEAAGGAVLLPKTPIGDPGFIALIRDTEGNCVGLHAPR